MDTLIKLTTAKLARKKGFKLYSCVLDKWLKLSTLRVSQSIMINWLRIDHNIFIQSKQTLLSDTEFIIVDNCGKELSPPKIYMYYGGYGDIYDKLSGLEPTIIKALHLLPSI